MAHYAFLNMQNIVTEVIVGKDETDGPTNWEIHYGNIREQVCKRTSYNTAAGEHIKGGTPFRKNYAGIGYTYDNGTWIKPGEKQFDYWAKLRYNRDKRLIQSDWKVLPGSIYESKLEEWKIYRQALRDLPANTADPSKVVYPTRPSDP